ncbi:MG2 domain-containing protein [Flavobacterium sp. I3-2]|uniref:alpha-2-macroglobulin family protein n=1 Tax=Flavobacterium sp. I3-2 TaxID=2748319 RepID=UPI0015ABA22B|nr:MG2 domain-containing protein [Flavobacterium sp. I3-2]
MKSKILLFFLFVSVSIFAQDYKKQWNEVYELEQKGSYKTLNSKLEQIYKSAKKENNQSQKAKAFIYQMKVDNVLKETNYQKKVERLRLEIAESTGVYKEVFRWYYIKTLMNAYNSKFSNWRYYGGVITNTTELPKNIDLWTQQQFQEVISEQTNLLFAQEDLMKKTSVDKIKDLIDYDFIDNNLNQSVYDFFAINFINDYASQRYVIQPSQDIFNRFDGSFCNSKIIFSENKDYLDFREELSKQAALLLQNLEKQYLQNNQDLLLDKIRFVRLEKFGSDVWAESETFQNLGKNLKTNFYKNRWQSMYANKLAQEANKTDKKGNYETALKVIDEVKKSKTENNQLQSVLDLENSIKNKDFAVSLKQEVFENEPVKYLINYKNIDTLHLAYYDFSKHKTINDSIFKMVVKNDKPLKKSVHYLPQDFPYFQNTTEILGEQLPIGNYLLVSYSDDKDLDIYDSKKAQVFKTTNVMLLTKNIDNETSAIFVLNPKTGKPYANKATLFNRKRYVSDANGKIIVPNKRERYDTNTIELFVNNEIYRKQLYLDSWGQSIQIEKSQRDANIDLFTDRSIYRPGQEVHFKGILYEMNANQNQVLSNKSFKVILEDDNGDEVDEKLIKSNELGGFSGSFVLPKSIPTGEFSIRIRELDDYADAKEAEFWKALRFPDKSFDYRVEEYKRPTYNFEFDEIKGNVFFDEKITISGKAESLAGGAIANAKVKLKSDINFYDYETRKYIQLLKIDEEILTDDFGKFEYHFTIPSDSLGNRFKEEIIRQNISIEAEVTDQAGEVKEDNLYFYISNTAVDVSVYSIGNFITNKPLEVSVGSQKHNGGFLPITGTIKIYQTLPKDKFYETRPWQIPELKSMDEITFRKLFPYQAYDSEELKNPEKTLIYEGSYTTAENKKFELDIKDWKTGAYELVFETIDSKSKLPIKRSTNFSIKKVDEKLAKNENVTFITNPKSTASQLILEVNSIYDDVTLFIEYFDRDASIQSRNFSIRKGSQFIRIPLADSFENENISYQWFFVQNQNLYSGNGDFNLKKVEEKNHPVWEAEWQAWNNKLTPAQQYQWKLILKDSKTNKPFQGEFLASMYDASLDMIYSDFWKTNSDKIYNYSYVNFSRPTPLNNLVSNRIYNSYTNYSAPLYWNTWDYFGYDFNLDSYYNYYYSNGARNGNAKYYQIEVRDEQTDKLIANARVYNLKTANQSTTNEDGFASILGDENPLIAVAALGYKEKRQELKNLFTVIYLKSDEEPISQQTVDELREINLVWNLIFRKYSKLLNKEEILSFEENVIKEQTLGDNKVLTDEISGFVYAKNYGDPIPGASLLIEGTFKGCDTDADGFFKLKAKQGDVITVNFLGFKTFSFIVSGLSFNISLEEDNLSELNDVVIDTYRSTSRAKSSVAASTVTSKTIEGRPNASFVQTLEAQVPGLNIATNREFAENAHKAITLRKNLNETAFFIPHIQTSKNGEIVFDFTAPESLTEWKFRGLAHNKNAEFVYLEAISKTQKDVMIQPNMPRFVRETDEIELKARVSNTTNDKLKATAMLRLFNTITGEDLTKQILKSDDLIPVEIVGFSSNTVSWKVQIPKNIIGLQYRISVQAGNFTDGEESVIPVLSNRQLVTETLPVWQLANQTKTYELTNLVENQSSSLENHQLRIDISNNATWLMMQSFPYLMDYPYDCSEQLFSKYFAASIALHIVEENPLIEKLVKEWKENPTSKLEENEELKQILLQDSPWMRDLISDQEKKAQFVSNFDINHLEQLAERIEDKLIERQMSSGALPWFTDGYENPYITWQIVVTAAQLSNLGIKSNFLNGDKGFIYRAQNYLDTRFEKSYSEKHNASVSNVIDYAFMKSYFADRFTISDKNQKQIDKVLNDYREKWVSFSLYEKAKLIIVLARKGETVWAKEIINQLEESAVIDETFGMYWRANSSRNYYYYNAAEVQAMIIEAYKTMQMPEDKIQRLNAWLLSKKVQNDWGTTKATTQSLYALILGQQDMDLNRGLIELKVSKEKKNVTKDIKSKTEEEVGIFTYQWLGDAVKSEMGTIEIKNTTPQPVFGGIYWQYFEDMDKIKSSPDGILTISRGYYIENKDGKWDLITPKTPLVLGQKVKVRIEFEAIQEMSYLHIKDNRPATFEPLDAISGQRYGNGLRYYQSTKDASTNFFIDHLNKGKYVLEYNVRLNNIGNFTSGISTIQSMYAPEHASHTSGDKVEVK